MQMRLVKDWLALPGRSRRLLSDLRLWAQIYDTNCIMLAGRLAHLRLRGGFSPREAFEEGLLDRSIAKSTLALTVSKRSLVELQARVNPKEYDCLTEDKNLFSAYCHALGLPTPRLLGVAARPVGFSADGSPLRDAADWRSFVSELPDEFVVKPSRGVYGWGVEIFQRVDGGFAGSASGHHSNEGLIDFLFTDPRYSSFVIQERLHAHPAMTDLSGTPYLQTVRMVTDVDEHGICRIVFAAARIIASEVVVDNYAKGHNGNLIGFVDLAEGTLDFLVGPGPGGIGTEIVRKHPRTGRDFQGFRLPDWEAACALAKRAALLFQPMRTLGWDIALCLDGPRIVEANKRWDPLNFLVVKGQIPARTEELARLLVKLRSFTRR
jgi:hypothetical protein